MKIVCHRGSLLSACQLALVPIAPVTDYEEDQPLFETFKLVADKESLTLMASDQHSKEIIGLRLEVLGAKIEEPGSHVYAAKLLRDILQHGFAEEIEIEDGSIRFGADEYECFVDESEGIPDVPTFAHEKYHEIPVGILQEMIARTAFAAVQFGQCRFEGTRGIRWELEGDNAAAIATDGGCMAIMRARAKAHGGHATNAPRDEPCRACVLPNHAALLLQSILIRSVNRSAAVRICCTQEGQAYFASNGWTMLAGLSEGRFPDYKGVIPSEFCHVAECLPIPLMAAMQRAGIMDHPSEFDGVKFTFTAGKVVMEAGGDERGNSHVELAVDYRGAGLSIRFNPARLIQALAVMDPTVPVKLEMQDNQSPVLFTQGKYLYVVVPHRQRIPRLRAHRPQEDSETEEP